MHPKQIGRQTGPDLKVHRGTHRFKEGVFLKGDGGCGCRNLQGTELGSAERRATHIVVSSISADTIGSEGFEVEGGTQG
jgi:hypothetical protein